MTSNRRNGQAENSTDIFFFHTRDPRERQLNLERYLISYPWISRIKDNNGYLAFHCGLCTRLATTNHLLSNDHNRKAVHVSPWVGTRMFPQWVRRWDAPRTEAEGAGLFTWEQPDVWPEGPNDERQRTARMEQSARFRCQECHHDFVSPQRDCKICRAGLEGGRRASKHDIPESHKRPVRHDEKGPPSKPASSSCEDPGDRRQQNRQGKEEGDTPPPRRRRHRSRDGGLAHRQGHDEQADQTSRDESVRNSPEPVDSALINSASRCEGETYLRPTFVRELDRSMACQLRLFNMDHYFPYGPWPLDFEEWSDFEKATMKETQGTAALGLTLRPEYHAKGDVGVKFNDDRWNMRTVRAGDKVVISSSRPSFDYVFDASVTSTQWGVVTLEWKSSWGRLQDYLPEHVSLCTFSPTGRFRADLHIEDISPGRVRSALDQLTFVWGEERRGVAFITPLQALIALQDLEVDDIVQINNAAADRLRYRRGFRDGAFVADDALIAGTRRMALLSLRIVSKEICRMAHLSLVNATTKAQDGMALLTLGQRDRGLSF